VSVEVVGIDEAGYGPLLGPLVVAAVAVRVPAASACPWTLLASAVASRPAARGPRLLVADSKLVLRGRGAAALARLELPVLAFLHVAGVAPRRLEELLAAVAPGGDATLTEPWYRDDATTLPVATSADAVAAAAERLAATAARAGTGLAAVRCSVLGEGRYNRAVAAAGNKAAVLFDLAAKVLAAVRCGATRRVVVDRQGGRARYGAHLQRALPGAFVWTEGESAAASSYRVCDGVGEFELSFEVAADRRHFSVALASMVAKYVRELCMDRFNRYWAARVPGLAPTAGYWSDGLRFLAEVERAAVARPLGDLPVRRVR